MEYICIGPKCWLLLQATSQTLEANGLRKAEKLRDINKEERQREILCADGWVRVVLGPLGCACQYIILSY
jgi:hypothetical protein